jgi:hypothetical protein
MDARRMAGNDGDVNTVGYDGNTERSGQGVGHWVKLAWPDASASEVDGQGEERVGERNFTSPRQWEEQNRRSLRFGLGQF